MSKIPCPHCGKPIKSDAIVCKHCGKRRFKPSDKIVRTPTKITDTYTGWKLIGFALAFLFVGMFTLCLFTATVLQEL